MKIKLDENFGISVKNLFAQNGFNVFAVRDENLQGVFDEKLFNVCKAEQRILVTLDLDFSDIKRFNHKESSGIVIIRPPKGIKYNIILEMIEQLINYMKTEEIKNDLLIVEYGRLRKHQS